MFTCCLWLLFSHLEQSPLLGRDRMAREAYSIHWTITIHLLITVCWPLGQTCAGRYATVEWHGKDEPQTSPPKTLNYNECKMLIMPRFNSFSYLKESKQFSSPYVCGLTSKSIFKLLKKGLVQHCPKELSAMMEIFYICTLQYWSHQPHVAAEHLKRSWYDQGTERNFN